ncbi:MAG: hypothetical protein LBE35_07155 [Clostridiales bacterium]|nr:hypothetical protein [Clostridiales bacterium]
MENNRNISATGANKFDVGFAKSNLDTHWKGGASDHSKEYPGYTKEQYAKEALDLIQSAVTNGIEGYKNSRGQIVRYDFGRNNFVKGHPNIGIATMFKPDLGAIYFYKEKEREALKEEE